jgi:exosortase
MSSHLKVFGLLTLALLAVHALVIRALFDFAWGNSTASHVLLIPVVSAALLIRERDMIFSSTRPEPLAGGLVAATGIAVSLAGTFIGWGSLDNALSVQVAGIVVTWIGIFLSCFGVATAKAAMFPLLFLLLTIPPPTAVVEGATQLLKVGSTETVAALFTLTGTPYYRTGFVFTLPDFAIEVADECSGIRSSIGLLLTTLLASHTFLQRGMTKTALLAAVLPIAILKNGIRIVSLTLLATHVDPGFLTGQLHHEGGVAFFALALVMLLPLFVVLRRFDVAPTPVPQPSGN